MFDIAPTEMMLVALVALVVIGPKDLPRVLRVVGSWVGRARTMARHFRSGIDEMVRQSELEELQKKWEGENERIMREHPAVELIPTPEEQANETTAADDTSSSSATSATFGVVAPADESAPELPLAPPPEERT